MVWHAPISGTTQISSNTAGDGIFIGPDVTLSVSNSSAVFFQNANHIADIYGTVVSTFGYGVSLGFFGNQAGHRIDIHAGAFVRSYDSFAVQLSGYGTRLTNAGDVSGIHAGVYLASDHASTTSHLSNSGVIRSSLATGSYGAVTHFGTEKLTLVNTGTISGALIAFHSSGSSAALITNNGRMVGTLVLDGGNDRYLGGSGRLNGDVFGGSGADTLVGGLDGDEFDGGTENDTLTGNGGNDTLKGDAGADKLNGGAGKDILTGGVDADRFIFSAKTHSVTGVNADRIMDFDDGNTGDRIDLSALFGPAMSYRHSGAFTAAGQVRINDVSGLDVVVEVNTGGTLAADFSIRLVKTTLASMNAGDFVL